MNPTLAIDPADFDALLIYFARANQLHYDGYLTADQFDAVQDYVDTIKDLALNHRV
jgi:hypothetical protein